MSAISKELQDIELLFAEKDKQIAGLKAKVRELEQTAKVPEKKRVTSDLKEFPSVEEIEWEKEGHTAKSWILQIWSGKNKDLRDWKHVLVDGVEWRRFEGKAMPDWYAIAHHRIYDVTASVWAAKVQPGDDGFEDDPEDMVELIQNYNKPLRYNPEFWKNDELGAKLLKEFYKTHDTVEVLYPDERQVPSTPTI